MGPGVLSEVVGSLKKFSDKNLIVGFDTSDDACVYKIRDDLAVIQTVDFFPPMVDNPYMFGQIAAANALSDVYAMGGEPSLALNLLMIPSCLPVDAVRGILEGGADKVREAGGVIAGGHTIEDPEPKYGLSVSGFINPGKIWGNASAREGDVLVLTKPLGSGIITTAAKLDAITQKELEPAANIMAELNKSARSAALSVKVNACTDITGFGLLGHAKEMAEASGVGLEIFSEKLVFMDKAEELSKAGMIPGGAYRNREYMEGSVYFSEEIKPHIQDIMFDPQTSGGLLFSVPAGQAEILLRALEEFTPYARIVGQVLPYSGRRISVVK